MASRKTKRKFADGTTREFVRKKQGRHVLPDELRKVKVVGYILPARRAILEREAAEAQLSLSEYIGYKLTLGVMQLPESENW